MKTFIFALLFALNARAFQSLLTGVDSSGGGNAVVCRDSHDKIKSAELLDLFEARILYGLKIPHSKVPAVEQAEKEIRLIAGLNRTYLLNLPSDFQRVVKIAHILPIGVTLQPINDSFSPVIPKDCKIEQLAAYQINNELYIDGEIWKALDETNRAALYVHESVYKRLRVLGATNSIRSRKINGYAFANFQFKPALDLSLETPQDLLCESDDDAFWNAKAEIFVHFHDSVATIYFVGLAGQPVFSEKTIDVPVEIFANGDGGRGVFTGGSPTTNFEGGEEVQILGNGSVITLDVKGSFGDDSLNARYVFPRCMREK